jgi:hypothetical protein
MHKSVTKCNETIGKWCKNKHGASKIIDTFETYQGGQERRLSDLESIIGAVASMCERKKMIVFLAWAPPVSDRTKMVRSLGSG